MKTTRQEVYKAIDGERDYQGSLRDKGRKNMTTDQDYGNCAKVIKALLENEAHKSTLFISDKLTLVATRKLFNGKPGKRQIEIGLTYGPPNYENRKFIKLAKLVKEQFPIKKIQLKFPSKVKRK